MAEEKKKRMKKIKPPRQDWNPHWALRVLYRLWMIAFSAFKVAVGAFATVLLIGVVCGFVFVGILGDYLQDDILPDSGGIVLDANDYDQNSNMYCVNENGQIQVYQQIFAETSSKWANLEDIPEDLIAAAVSIEDHRFYEHQGVDWVTTIKACARMFFGDDSVGGSSITQQLIKNILLLAEDETADDVTVRRKVIEIFRAIQVEKKYDKDEIMEMYLNCIYLGQGCRGVRSAAAAYFGKEVEMLTTAECAALISITNSPTYYDPYQNFENNKARKEDVLWAMREYGWINEDTYQEALAQELVLKAGIDDEDRLTSCTNEICGYTDIARNFVTQDNKTYFCPECNAEVQTEKDASRETYSWFADTVLEDVAQAMCEKNGLRWNSTTREMMIRQIQKGGYHIYTTVDLKVQEELDAVYTNVKNIPDTHSGQQLQSAMVIIDNTTGDIVAMVGGVGEKEGFDDWNRATESKLQTGSSIKPLSVYAPAFESGAITPATVIKDLPLTYDDSPYPRNDDYKYSYARTIFRGVVRSVNAVCARTLDKSGVNYSYEFAKNKFRLVNLIDSYEDSDGYVHSDIGIGPLAIGAQTWGLTVREMANAYSTFTNDGIWREARTFTKVYDSEGNLILDNAQESEQILSEKTVNYMNYCLVNATAGGTGYEANLSWTHGITTAGKTGTTGDSKDRWYCGYTGYYTAAVWCGYDKPEKIYTYNVNNPAAHLFKKVMVPLHEDKDDISLYSTKNFRTAKMCLTSGKLATDACRNDIRLDKPLQPDDFISVSDAYVYYEDYPKETCDQHVMVDYCSGGGVATQWCEKFAKVDSGVKMSERGLVKLTQKDIDELLKAAPYGLYKDYLRNDYVYFLNSDGTDGVFKGIKNDLKQSVEAPYMVCPKHTKAAWEKYIAIHGDPDAPTESTESTEATESVEPTETTESMETTEPPQEEQDPPANPEAGA
ncbi:MAG: transglycosylase domain-containing protein [Oscillospiraceae bacterium]|nr:transglycosylase domain-containing protein [Oscillospiraceae bacterium]